jgi:hypothetical protein
MQWQVDCDVSSWPIASDIALQYNVGFWEKGGLVIDFVASGSAAGRALNSVSQRLSVNHRGAPDECPQAPSGRRLRLSNLYIPACIAFGIFFVVRPGARLSCIGLRVRTREDCLVRTGENRNPRSVMACGLRPVLSPPLCRSPKQGAAPQRGDYATASGAAGRPRAASPSTACVSRGAQRPPALPDA